MRPYLLLINALLAFFLTNAQVRTNFNNREQLAAAGKFNRAYETAIDLELPSKDIKQLLAQENEMNKGTSVKPLQIAVPVPADIDIAGRMKWSANGDYSYGRYSIRLKGALTASINFDKFYLPKGTELYVYNENGEMITGPVTEAENNASRIWGSWVYKGDIITVEVKTPSASQKDLQLHAGNLAYGYKEIYKVADFGASGSCNINVLCPLGNGWEGERNAVALILGANGGSLCSGSLVMNTCSTSTPYFLTANHCFDGDGNVGSWRFTFQAWSPTCQPSQNSNGITFNGSTLRARNAASDFCLVELNNTPPANSNLHYAGWSRSTTPATQATAIHHPRGDVMKISRANNPLTVASYAGTTNQHWRADWSAQDNGTGTFVTAVTEPGSSGSPLFDQNHRIVGQLHGGPSACGATNLWDFYGRFDLSWAGGGTTATGLSDWLDPSGSNAAFTNTTNISNLGALANVTIAGPDNFCSGSANYQANGLPAGATVCWSVNSTAFATVNPACGPATTLTKQFDGRVTLTATLSFCGNVRTIEKVVDMGNPFPTGTTWATSNYNTYSGTLLSSYSFFLPSGQSGVVQNNISDSRYSSITWTPISTPSGTSWSTGGPNNGTINFSVTASGPAYSSTTITVRMNAQGPCGAYNMDFAATAVVRGWSFTASPNPAHGQLQVKMDGESGKVANEPLSIMLYNVGSTTLYRKWDLKNNQQSFTLNVAGIKKGQYLLVVKKGTEQKTKQIMID